MPNSCINIIDIMYFKLKKTSFSKRNLSRNKKIKKNKYKIKKHFN